MKQKLTKIYQNNSLKISVNNGWCKACGICIEFCPKHVLEESEIFNAKGYHPPEVAYPDNCVGCRLCELICPEFAIYVTVEDETSAQENSQAPTDTDIDADADADPETEESASDEDVESGADPSQKQEVQA